MNTKHTLLFCAALAAGAFTAAAAAADKPAQAGTPGRATVVLVHGAFADGSSWSKLIPLLQAQGLKVVAVQNPLTSLEEDVRFTNRVVDAQTAPVVLVGHSWGGSVISQAGGNDKVKALVYVAAFAPSVGETSIGPTKAYPPAPGLASPISTPDGYLKLSTQAVRSDFAQDVSAEEANLIDTTQGAVNGKAFETPLTVAAWTTKPSWYIVAAEDRMIQPALQKALAAKIKARTTTLATSHVPMISRPQDVAKVIVDAAASLR